MKIIESILKKNPCYTAGKKITVKGLMLHSVGCPQPKASVFINSWNSPSYDNACVHAFIDGNTGDIYQTLPWNHRGWHGGGSSNNTHIGVEMCEPACIKYTGGSSFTCSDKATAKAVVKRTYESAVELFAFLCEKYNLNPLADGVIVSHREGHARGIASNHGDPEHLWKGLGLDYTMNGFRKDVKAKMNGEEEKGFQASELKNLTEAQIVAKIGHLFTEDQKKTGILASVSMAQFILESGYGKSELAQNANNCFGMKKSLSGNTWSGSAWDGKSVYTKKTQEQNPDGSYETITAEFRKYSCIEDSIADHGAYLLGAKNGSTLRYAGLKGEKNYKKAITIIKNGGYATSLTYVDKICDIIDRWNLTQYDVKETTSSDTVNEFPATPFMVKVIIDDLNYRSAPSMEGKVEGQTGKGTFTITEVRNGWGKLKSGAGWIWLKNPSYCTIKGTVQTETKKSVTEIAKEVIQGKWGNGSARKEALTKAGYDYSAVQKKVNELLS